MLNELTRLIPGCVGASDLGDRYEVMFADRTKRDATPEEIAAAEAMLAAQAEEQARQKADQKDLRDQFQQAADILDQIINAPSMTQAQAVAAIRQLATIQKRVLRAIYPLMTE